MFDFNFHSDVNSVLITSAHDTSLAYQADCPKLPKTDLSSSDNDLLHLRNSAILSSLPQAHDFHIEPLLLADRILSLNFVGSTDSPQTH